MNLSVFSRLSGLIFILVSLHAAAQQPKFKVIGFYTAKNDLAHISFVHEANNWFANAAKQYQFTYDSTNDWNNLNDEFLTNYNVVMFFDTRPDSLPQRVAFEKYMNQGGSWMGFHFAAFALTPSAYPQNWDWYHNQFIGAGEYKSNTWRPTSAFLQVENTNHPSVAKLPTTFRAAPNEWYKWTNDLTKNPAISVLLAIDAKSFPLGTGPKQHEIWHSGYYPVAWTNRKYNMIYMNMGHNDMDYEGKTNAQLSSSFSSNEQNTFILNSLLWLAEQNK